VNLIWFSKPFFLLLLLLDGNQLAIDAGVIGTIITAMKMYPKYFDLQRNAFGAFWNLTSHGI